MKNKSGRAFKNRFETFNGIMVSRDASGRRICNILGCLNVHEANGWCSQDYHLSTIFDGPPYTWKPRKRMKKPVQVTLERKKKPRTPRYHFIDGVEMNDDVRVTRNAAGKRICNVDECTNKHESKGWCTGHLRLWSRDDRPKNYNAPSVAQTGFGSSASRTDDEPQGTLLKTTYQAAIRWLAGKR